MPSLANIKTFAKLPATALRIARTQSTKLLRLTDSQMRKWRAIYARRRSAATFIAVTGSSAKTTTAALISHILADAAPVQSQVGNNVLRSHITSLQSVPREVSFFVSETCAFGPGTSPARSRCGQTNA